MSAGNAISAVGAQFAASYLHATISGGDQSNFNQDVVLNSVLSSAGSDISLNTATGEITLQPGSTYRLTANMQFISMLADWAVIEWVDASNVKIAGSTEAQVYRVTSTTASTSQNNAEVVLTPDSVTVVKLRTSGMGNTASITGSTNNQRCSVIVEKIAGDAAANPQINDQSALGYIDIGNARWAWGRQAQNAGAVTFPGGGFSSTPSVTAGSQNGDVYIGIASLSTTGFSPGVYNFNGSVSNSVFFSWQAIGIKP